MGFGSCVQETGEAVRCKKKCNSLAWKHLQNKDVKKKQYVKDVFQQENTFRDFR